MPHKFTVEEYLATPLPERTELIDGVVYDIALPSNLHAYFVREIANLLIHQLWGKANVYSQNPLDMGNIFYMPQPDITLLQLGKKFKHSYPTAADTLLVIEVADSTLEVDKNVKAKAYRDAGIQDVIVLDVNGELIYWYSPHGLVTLGFGEAIMTLANGMIVDLRAALG